MAITMVRLWHTGETRPVAVKQKAQEESGAHPKHTRAERWTGGATEKLVVDHSGHGGEADVDGGVPVAAVDKRSNQKVTERHGNKEKLEPGLARTETHQRTLATVTQAHRRCGRLRGRKAMRSVSR